MPSPFLFGTHPIMSTLRVYIIPIEGSRKLAKPQHFLAYVKEEEF